MRDNMQDEDKTKEQLFDEVISLRQRAGKLLNIWQDLDASAYTVAHDLKRSLSLILGFSEVLKREYATVSREELLRSLKVIVESGREMNGIIDELMLLTHLRDEESPNVGPLEMGDVVADALSRLNYLIERRQVEITVPDLWPEVLGYAPWIEEVWFAFLIEALQFDVDPLRIEIGAREEEDGRGRFWVRIDGDDFTPEQEAQVSQAHSSFKPGLMQRIMENLGGQFGITREEGRGCEFYFTLPGKGEA